MERHFFVKQKISINDAVGTTAIKITVLGCELRNVNIGIGSEGTAGADRGASGRGSGAKGGVEMTTHADIGNKITKTCRNCLCIAEKHCNDLTFCTINKEGYLSGVYSYGECDNSQSTLAQALLPKLQKQPITLTSSISFLFSRLDQYTTNQKDYTRNKQGIFQDYWKSFKKVTSQSDSENCLSQIHYHFSNKFSPRLVKYRPHRKKCYHKGIEMSRQELVWLKILEGTNRSKKYGFGLGFQYRHRHRVRVRVANGRISAWDFAQRRDQCRDRAMNMKENGMVLCLLCEREKTMHPIVRFLKWVTQKYITNSQQTPKIQETRDMDTGQTRETPHLPTPKKPPSTKKVRGEIKTTFKQPQEPVLPLAKPKLVVAQSALEAKVESALLTGEPGPVKCIYCAGAEVVKRGLRKKKLETVQLYFCHHCKRTFVWQRVKGKRFPLRIILEGLSLYNIGHTLEESCKRLKEQFGLEAKPFTLSLWVKEFESICRYNRLRPYGLKLYTQNQIIQTVHLFHRQVYDFSVHKGKLALLLQEYKYGNFDNLREFLEAVQSECPHQGNRNSDRFWRVK